MCLIFFLHCAHLAEIHFKSSTWNGNWRSRRWKGGAVATVAFSGGGFHLQIQRATLGYKMKMSLRSKKIPSVVYSLPLFLSCSRETGNGGGLECYLFCGKMSRGILNIAHESWYLSEEEPTCKSQNFYYGLRCWKYICGSGWCSWHLHVTVLEFC